MILYDEEVLLKRCLNTHYVLRDENLEIAEKKYSKFSIIRKD